MVSEGRFFGGCIFTHLHFRFWISALVFLFGPYGFRRSNHLRTHMLRCGLQPRNHLLMAFARQGPIRGTRRIRAMKQFDIFGTFFVVEMHPITIYQRPPFKGWCFNYSGTLLPPLRIQFIASLLKNELGLCYHLQGILSYQT